MYNALLVPLLAVFTAFVIGGIIIWITTGDIMMVIGPDGAFVGLWKGAFGTPRNIADTLTTATPYIFAAWRWRSHSSAASSISGPRGNSRWGL
jgi:ABC-type uncharacterized transport system permease subunit